MKVSWDSHQDDPCLRYKLIISFSMLARRQERPTQRKRNGGNSSRAEPMDTIRGEASELRRSRALTMVQKPATTRSRPRRCSSHCCVSTLEQGSGARAQTSSSSRSRWSPLSTGVHPWAQRKRSCVVKASCAASALKAAWINQQSVW
jgi:hypothetical protein